MSRDRHLSPAAVHALTLPTEPYLSCEECFDLMDEFTEALVEGAPPPRATVMRVHLGACAACLEEVDSLVNLVAADANADAEEALARLRS